jgi:hypothetical protein
MTGQPAPIRRSLWSRESAARLAFAAVAAGWLTSALLVGRFPHTDEVPYKCPGLHWAREGYWAAPEIAGHLDVDPPVERIYAMYPPLYPAGFGLAVWCFGFGWRTCVLYDGLIHIALAVLTALLARRFGASAGAAWGMAVLVLFLGTLGRPDELAMCFGLSAVLVLRPGVAGVGQRWLAAACLLGCCGATSPGPGSSTRSCCWRRS